MFFMVFVQGGGKRLLRPFLPVFVDQKREVGVMRGSEAEAALQVDLARGGNEQVLPAYDVCNAFVGNDGKLVRPKSVGAQEDEVANVAGEVLGVMSDDTVVKSDGFVVDADAPCGRFVGVGAIFEATCCGRPRMYRAD